jgi:muconate cycloisomerase
VVTLDDALRVIEARAADIFNVRIGKCGGIFGSKRIVDEARRANIDVHLGTLVGETGILTRAAEIFGRAIPEFACLDGKGQNEFLLTEDLLEDPRSAQTADPFAPGLGVDVSRDRLAAHARESPLIF